MTEDIMGASASTPTEPGVDAPETGGNAPEPTNQPSASTDTTNQSPEPPESDSQPEEELFTIKVRGEEKQVTKDELINLAQMGEDYTRKTQELAVERKLAERLRQMGYEPQQLLEEWEAQEMQEQAQKAGVDPEFYQSVINMQAEFDSLKREKTMMEQDAALQNDPVHGELYKKWQKDVRTYAEQLGTDIETAYTLLLRERIPEILADTQRKGEQSAIKNIINRDNASAGPVDGAPAQLKTDIWSMKSDDFNQMIEKAKRGELKNL